MNNEKKIPQNNNRYSSILSGALYAVTFILVLGFFGQFLSSFFNG